MKEARDRELGRGRPAVRRNALISGAEVLLLPA